MSKRSAGAAATFTLLLTFCLAQPVSADGAASIDPEEARMRASFENFADGWIEKLQRHAELERRSPGLKASGLGERSYRAYTKNFRIELRPTGHPVAPYVGLLRYHEHIHTCDNGARGTCPLSAKRPVTEIFRFQDGRWVY